MHPPPAHGFPRLVRKKADWGDWVVSPVWIVMEPTAKRTLNGGSAVSPRFPAVSRTRLQCPQSVWQFWVSLCPHAAHFSVPNLICFCLAPLCRLFLHAT